MFSCYFYIFEQLHLQPCFVCVHVLGSAWLLVFVVLLLFLELFPWLSLSDDRLSCFGWVPGHGVVVMVHHDLCLSMHHMLDSSVMVIFHLID